MSGASHRWLNWMDGTPVGSTPPTAWLPSQIPVFVAAGTIVPMRTMNSTYSAFVDPLVWATWTSPGTNAGDYELYEDAGDGIEYENAPRGAGSTWPQAHSMTSASLVRKQQRINGAEGHALLLALFFFKVRNSSGAIVVTIRAARGRFAGQGQARQQLVQLRGCHGTAKHVRVNNQEVNQISPATATAGAKGWFVAPQSEAGRDNFTQPAGVLVVAVGWLSIRSVATVTAMCSLT